MTFTAWLAVIIAPLSVGAALFVWQLNHDDELENGPEPYWRLPRILAVLGTFAAAVAVFVGWVAVLYLLGNDLFHQLSGAATGLLVAVELIPIANAAYLRWLRGRS